MRILIIDDEKEITDFLATHLRSESFAVDVASDGESGSYLGRTNDYALILLDVTLPKKSGLDVLKELRLQGKMMPVIVLSVTSETETKIDFLNAGADDYLVKPSSYFELLARIRALLRRPAIIKEDILTLDTLVVDVKKHEVTRSKKPIQLTQKEFMLLAFL
ncbi:MAG: response regulator transcription factor, partial [Candidatus Shapirobacteria bacterium]